eukprot:scaffold29634_cov171-Amphora_coffeaeformis.AAC.1
MKTQVDEKIGCSKFSTGTSGPPRLSKGISSTSMTTCCSHTSVADQDSDPAGEMDQSNHTSHVSKCLTGVDIATLSSLQDSFNRLERLFPDPEEGALPEDFPTFFGNEIVPGLRLGRGSFSDVMDVERIKVKKSISYKADEESRAFISSRCLTPLGETRFAIKKVRQDSRQDPGKSWMNYADLLVETRLLSQLEHPNIIKLRAIAANTVPRPDYFIVLDRLHDTLKQRMDKWKSAVKAQKQRRIFSFLLRDKTKWDALWDKRLTHACHLASAIEYMHEHCVIHRDIKPGNIGFDRNDDIKVFDFGLSRPILSTKDVYHMSMAGSLRYMAPE